MRRPAVGAGIVALLLSIATASASTSPPPAPGGAMVGFSAPASSSPATESPAEAAPATEPAVLTPPDLPPFDVAVLATGIRASRVMGKAVRNEAAEEIGTVNDLIINPPDSVAYAIIGVGGFLGVGERLVAVPFDALHPRETGQGLILPGATKDSVKLLPEFKYPPRADRPPAN